MAYRRSSRRRVGGRRYTRRTGGYTSRVRARSAYGARGRRRTTYRAGGRQQVVRLVIEQPRAPTTPIGLMPKPAPRKATF